jgi:hypothetical protein
MGLFRKKLFVLGLLSLLILSFQNCSPVKFSDTQASLDFSGVDCTNNPAQCLNPTSPQCSFNGQIYNEGQTINAFLSSSAPVGQVCVSEIRTCTSGAFTGSYTYPSCEVDTPASCLFDGKVILHGESVDAFQNSSVAYGKSCTKESRTCTNGTLSGSYNYALCEEGAPASCLFNGQTVAHGSSIKAFSGSSVAFGESCLSEDRTCTDGVLSGSYNFANCTVGAPASCQFNGQTIAHGASVISFQTSTVAYGQSCNSQTRICSNGALSGSHTYPNCTIGAPASCQFNGKTIAHGESVTAYASASVAYGSTCAKENRTCANGTLSGSNTYSSCLVQARTPVCRSVYVGETSENVCGTYIVGWEAVPYNSLYICSGGGAEYSCAPIYQNRCGIVTTPQYETVCE